MKPKKVKLHPVERDTRLNNFIIIPIDCICLDISPTALLVYGLLVSRAIMSARNDWTEDGRVYIRYSNYQLMEDTGIGLTTVKSALASLETAGLIERATKNRRDRKFFIQIPEDSKVKKVSPGAWPENRPGEARISTASWSGNGPMGGRKTDSIGGGKTATNIYSKNNNTNNKYNIEQKRSL